MKTARSGGSAWILPARFSSCPALLGIVLFVFAAHGNPPKSQRSRIVEYVTVEPPQIKTQADVTALALLQLCRYDFLAAPILVKPGKAADHAYAVEVFRLSSTTSSVESLLLRVECTAVGIVSIQEGKTVNTNQELQRRDI